MSGLGWFADIDRDAEPDEYRWQPCLDMDTGHIPCFEIWFKTKAECEAWIRDEVLPVASRMADDPPAQPDRTTTTSEGEK